MLGRIVQRSRLDEQNLQVQNCKVQLPTAFHNHAPELDHFEENSKASNRLVAEAFPPRAQRGTILVVFQGWQAIVVRICLG